MCKRPRRATATATDTDTFMRRKQIQIQIHIRSVHSHRQAHLGHSGRCHATCLFTFAALPLRATREPQTPPQTASPSQSSPYSLLLFPWQRCDRAYAAYDERSRTGRELRYSSWPSKLCQATMPTKCSTPGCVCLPLRVCVSCHFWPLWPLDIDDSLVWRLLTLAPPYSQSQSESTLVRLVKIVKLL